ncbi:MAG: ATP-binding cassette domain-containing protein [Candidatus Bipolaricaulis sp.]|nr:ATP-binding cassette domain-containing protein [Candidatus Bipolaricaulis sp.]
MVPSLTVHNVSFGYESAAAPLFVGVSFGLLPGWTGVIGANGAGKTTLLRLACRELLPQRGTIRAPDHVVYCVQRTDDPPPELGVFLASWDGVSFGIRRDLEIGDDWLTRWDTLSHGERKRAQIGVALWQEPDLLALDEPTNHLDLAARRLVLRSLRTFRGVGLLVSHDRILLDGLCERCLFIEPPHVVVRPGNYTQARAQRELEATSAHRARREARERRERLEHELHRRREQEAKAHRARSKRGIPRGDHDAKEKIDRARLADGGAGKRLRQIEGRLRRAAEEEASIVTTRKRKLGVTAPGTVASSDALFLVTSCSLPLGGQRLLRIPDLAMGPTDWVALVGPNGSGKSTLVRHIVSLLEPTGRRFVYMPQEIAADRSQDLLDEARSLSATKLAEVMAYVSRLGSDPERLLESELPSPGEVRKLLLGLRIASRPELLILDEPTNHMDLPSIECLEEALAGFPGGLLLVSHDEAFLRRLTCFRWVIERDAGAGAGRAFRLRQGGVGEEGRGR